MTGIESLVAGFKSDVALAVGQHRRIVGAGNVGNFCKSIDFHRQRYGAKLEGLRHQGFEGAEIDAAAAQIAPRISNRPGLASIDHSPSRSSVFAV